VLDIATGMMVVIMLIIITATVTGMMIVIMLIVITASVTGMMIVIMLIVITATVTGMMVVTMTMVIASYLLLLHNYWFEINISSDSYNQTCTSSLFKIEIFEMARAVKERKRIFIFTDYLACVLDS
jgi:hypothetical protein